MIQPCDACGRGPWVYEGAQAVGRSPADVSVAASCRHCQSARRFEFEIGHQLPPRGPQAEQINPTESPSELIDLVGWVSLFYLLVESAAAEPVAAVSRRNSFRAALCLQEAVKFYGDSELPGESAFFSDLSRQVFGQRPESFSRRRLRDMQAKLPSLGSMARRVARDQRVSDKRWWMFWRW